MKTVFKKIMLSALYVLTVGNVWGYIPDNMIRYKSNQGSHAINELAWSPLTLKKGTNKAVTTAADANGYKLYELEFSGTITEIPAGEFNISDIKEIELPSSITKINRSNFTSNNLTSFIFNWENPTSVEIDNTLKNRIINNSNIEIHVPAGSEGNYAAWLGIDISRFIGDVSTTAPTPNKAYFMVDGEEVSCTEAIPNRDIIFPVTEPTAPQGKEFYGWATTPIDGMQNQAPTVVTNKIMGNEDAYFYAVFRTKTEIPDLYTFTIDGKNLTGEVEATTSNNSKSLMVKFSYSNVSKDNNNNLKFGNKSLWGSFNKGSLYNTTPLGNIKSITGADGVTIYYGSNQQPSSNTSIGENNGYFNIINSDSKEATISSITVTFESGSTTSYSNYCTTTSFKFVANEDGVYYATFSCPENVVINADITAYNVILDDDKFTLYDLTEDCYKDENWHLPANTGYLLKASSDLTVKYDFESQSTGTANRDNLLEPCTKTATFEAKAGTYYYYKLAYGDNSTKSKLGFWWGADNGGVFKVKAGGAILAVPQQTQAASLMRGFSFTEKAENETDLEQEMIIESKPSAIFNLSGQRINKVSKSGLYIVNGKTQWINAK